MSPLSELRGAIPMALLYYKLSLAEAVFISIFGNILIVLLLLCILNYFVKDIVSHINFLKKIADWVFEKTRKRHKAKFAKWQDLALIVIVAIPLPFTGAWTGALASYVFGIPLKRSFPLITLGVLIAGIIVTLLTINGIHIFT
jgi:uncharacterized membrane protein